MARAAAVQAARQAFEDKEAAKTRKLEQQTIKAQDKQSRRKEKREQQHPGKLKSRSEHSLSETRANEKRPPLEGPEYGRIPLAENTYGHSRGASSRGKPSRGIASPKSAWVLFLTWLRTKIFKLGKKIKKSG
jgi:hypothetical protein